MRCRWQKKQGRNFRSRAIGGPSRGRPGNGKCGKAERFRVSVRLAVPEKPFGLTLILRFFDRCGKGTSPSSATGGGLAPSPSLDPPSFKRPKGACEPLLDFPGILRGAIAASSETTAVLASSAAALKRKMPPCGARKTLRAYADPRVFRPLRKKRAAFFCHRQRQHAFPPRGRRCPKDY